MPKSVYGEQEIKQNLPLEELLAPVRGYNLRLAAIMNQLLSIQKEEDKQIIIGRLQLLQEEIALQSSQARGAASVRQYTVSQANYGQQNTGSRS